LEDIRVPFKLRVVVILSYDRVGSKFRSNEGWLEEINCNIGVKQRFPLSTTLFGVYIDMLEDCLEEVGCASTNLVGLVIIFLLNVDDIFFWQGTLLTLKSSLKILKIFILTLG
jgi:hypothetical protein